MTRKWTKYDDDENVAHAFRKILCIKWIATESAKKHMQRVYVCENDIFLNYTKIRQTLKVCVYV